jgi:hypothetical protein
MEVPRQNGEKSLEDPHFNREKAGSGGKSLASQEWWET